MSRESAVAKLCQATGWTVDEAWAFIEALPYSTIPDEDDALAVLEHLGKFGAEYRVVGMDAPRFNRTSEYYPELEIVEGIRRARGGRIQRRLAIETEWRDV